MKCQGLHPKHTKSGRHKACLGSCANSCHREQTQNLGGWAKLGQTGCPETYSRDSCRSQSLSLADVQTTPSTGGGGGQTGGAGLSLASRDELQTSGGSYRCLFSIRQASAEPLLHVLHTENTAANTKAATEETTRHHSGSEGHGGETVLSRPLGGGIHSLLITAHKTEVSDRLSLGSSHPTCGCQDSVSALSGLVASKV